MTPGPVFDDVCAAWAKEWQQNLDSRPRLRVLMRRVIDDEIDKGADGVFGDGSSQRRAIVLGHGKIGANNSREIVAFKVTAQVRCIGFDVECDEALERKPILPINRAAAIQDAYFNHLLWLNPFRDGLETTQKCTVFEDVDS